MLMMVIRRAAIPVAWMVVLWILSSVPGLRNGTLGGIPIWPTVQNGLHPVAFGVLSAAWYWTLLPTGASGNRVWAFGLTTIYGMIDELHQRFVPGRTSSLLDVALDAAGAILALVIIAAREARRPA